MKTPEQFNESLTNAETACVAYLAAVLGMKPGVNFFRSVNPGSADCAVFDIGSPYQGDLNAFRPPKFWFRGQIDLYSRDRRLLQCQIMALMSALPVSPSTDPESNLRRETNVAQLRLAVENGNPSGITTTSIVPDTGKAGIPCFTATATFDIVFLVGQRPDTPVV